MLMPSTAAVKAGEKMNSIISWVGGKKALRELYSRIQDALQRSGILLSDTLITDATVPEGFHCYDLRGSDYPHCHWKDCMAGNGH